MIDDDDDERTVFEDTATHAVRREMTMDRHLHPPLPADEAEVPEPADYADLDDPDRARRRR